MTNSDNDILILFRTNEPQSMIAIGKGLKDKITEGQTYGILFKKAAGDQNSHCRNRAARNTFTATAILLYTEAGKKVSDTLKIEDQKIRCNELAPSENSSETQV